MIKSVTPMKLTLQFNLPEEREEAETALHGMRYRIALSDLDNYLRGKIKYEELSDSDEKIYQEIRSKLRECLDRLDI